MSRALSILSLVLRLTLIALIVAATIAVWRIQQATAQVTADLRAATAEAQKVANETKLLVNESRRVVAFQRAEFEDGQYQQRLKATIGQANTLIADLRTTTIPAFNASLLALGSAGQELQRAIAANSLASQQLVQELTLTAKALNVSVADTSAALTTLIQAGIVDAEEVGKILRDPSWQQVLQESAHASQSLAAASANVATITNNGAQASEQLPAVAKDVRAFTQAQSKYGKFVLLARILRALTF